MSTRYFEHVLTTFSREDTLTTSLQDWRKGRRSEVDDVNGIVVEVLKAHGRNAPINRRVVELARQIETGQLEPKPENAALMIDTFKQCG